MEAAKSLINSEEYQKEFNPQKHIPIQYLLRHSVELYLKSMIISIHVFLNLPYHKGSKSMLFLDKEGKERNIENSHWIDTLFWYWSTLLDEHKEVLTKKAVGSNWAMHPELPDLIDFISEYDRDGTYFRYPYGKKSNDKNFEKYSMKDISMDLEEVINKEKGSIITLVKDENDNVKDAYQFDESTLKEVEKALLKTAEILSGYHAMTRYTFFKGY